MNLDPGWVALIGTVFGGAGLKVAEHWLGKGRIRIDDATKMREELREQITSNKEEIDRLEAKVEKWVAEYYNLRDKYIQLQTELTLALNQIKDPATKDTIKSQVKTLDVPPLPVIDSE
jgi:peptidoglycan hydrolase CwlO-like protein